MVEGEPGGGGGGMEEALLVTRAMLPCCAVRLSGGPSGTGMGEGFPPPSPIPEHLFILLPTGILTATT